jgi:hypothetical protein
LVQEYSFSFCARASRMNALVSSVLRRNRLACQMISVSILPVFVREDQRYPDYGSWPAFQVRHALRAASWFYPNWDADLAAALVADFGLPLGRRVAKLSRGMRSALGIVIGLAARAEVTLFDEPYAGLDPVARKLFYDRMLADYAEHPRTVLLSTHLIDEAAGLMERAYAVSGLIAATSHSETPESIPPGASVSIGNPVPCSVYQILASPLSTYGTWFSSRDSLTENQPMAEPPLRLEPSSREDRRRPK